MLEHTDQQSLTDQFIAPALDALQNCEFTRRCPGLSDEQWSRMGIERALKECKTGRGFLQEWAMANSEEFAVGVGHFFETLKSARRLKLIAQINRVVAAAMPTHPDCRIDELEDLEGVDIYAGDGHYHKTSTHELPIKGKKRAVGHFYTLNMRSHALTHLTGADHEAGRKKGEHGHARA